MLCHAVAWEWVLNCFNPCSFSIANRIVLQRIEKEFHGIMVAVEFHASSRFQSLLKLYQKYKMPLNIFPIVPAIQSEFGETAALPFQ